jgi:hypothetical protein
VYYRLYFFDADGHIEAFEDLEATDDQSASTRAEALFEGEQRFSSGELWQETRLVRRFER